jgi:hypothetical protein
MNKQLSYSHSSLCRTKKSTASNRMISKQPTEVNTPNNPVRPLQRILQTSIGSLCFFNWFVACFPLTAPQEQTQKERKKTYHSNDLVSSVYHNHNLMVLQPFTLPAREKKLEKKKVDDDDDGEVTTSSSSDVFHCQFDPRVIRYLLGSIRTSCSFLLLLLLLLLTSLPVIISNNNNDRNIN